MCHYYEKTSRFDDLGRLRHRPHEGNAIAAANKPNLDKIFAENPHTQIGASGMDVGLPDGQMGNSYTYIY